MKTDPNAIGAAAENAFLKHLKAKPNVTPYRWPDAKGAIKKAQRGPQPYRGKVAKAPADFIALDFRPGMPPTVFYEVKATTNRDGIPFANFAPHQLATADKFDPDMHDRGVAFFFVIHDASRKDWYSVPGYVVTTKHLNRNGRDLIPWKEIITYRTALASI